MYCPACGFEYTSKTNYCKRCGEELNSTPQTTETKPSRLQVTNIFMVVAIFGAVGLLMNLISFHNLIRRGVPISEAQFSFALGLLMIGGIAGIMLWQLSRLITGHQRSNQSPVKERVIIREVQSPQLGALSDASQRAVEPPSVVEHTTRQFANLYESPKVEEKITTR